jgi:hypothetical protein
MRVRNVFGQGLRKDEIKLLNERRLIRADVGDPLFVGRRSLGELFGREIDDGVIEVMLANELEWEKRIRSAP